ncbi:hypothetical protein D3C74_498460 [compost metagenome]
MVVDDKARFGSARLTYMSNQGGVHRYTAGLLGLTKISSELSCFLQRRISELLSTYNDV